MSTNTVLKDFDTFLKERIQASDAFVSGEYDPLGKVSTQVSPATLFGPSGTSVEGADTINSGNANGAKHFKAGSTNDLYTLHSSSSGDLAYWVGIQRSVVQVQGKEKGEPMNLRVTELYRREEGDWKMFHRHADMLKESKG